MNNEAVLKKSKKKKETATFTGAFFRSDLFDRIR